MSFLLFILSFVLVVVFTPIGLIFTTLKSISRLELIPIRNYYMDLAISLDQFGNVAMKGILNILLINTDLFLFGNPDETISSVLGKNKLNDSLTEFGKLLDKALNELDINHSINSIEEDEN